MVCALTVGMAPLGRTPLYGDPGALVWELHYTSMYSVSSPSVVVIHMCHINSHCALNFCMYIWTYMCIYVHTSVHVDTMYVYAYK